MEIDKDFNKLFNRITISKTVGCKPYIDDYEKILQICKNHGITKGEAVRTIINDWFNNAEDKWINPKLRAKVK